MDAAAKKWIGEYKKLFDQVAARNAGMNVVEDVTTVERKEEITLKKKQEKPQIHTKT